MALSILSNIDFTGLRRSRNAILSASVFLLVVSNITLASDRLNLFGLEFIVSINELVSVARVVLVLALLNLSGALVRESPKNLARFLRWRDEKWWLPIGEQIDEMHRGQGPDDDYWEQRGLDWDDEAYIERDVRKQKRLRVARWLRPISLTLSFTSYVIFPLALAFLSLFAPHLILQF